MIENQKLMIRPFYYHFFFDTLHTHTYNNGGYNDDDDDNGEKFNFFFFLVAGKQNVMNVLILSICGVLNKHKKFKSNCRLKFNKKINNL